MLASAAVLALSLNSCSDDDSGSGSVSGNKLEGKWERNTQKLSAIGQTTGEQPYLGNEEGCSKDFIEFGADGAYAEGDYFGDGCTLTTTTGTYTVDGKDVTVTGNAADEYTVVSVSGSKLKIKYVTQINGVNLVDEYTFTKAN